jgi:hypothetical protein
MSSDRKMQKLKVEDGLYVDPLEKIHTYYLNRSTTMYGASESGKSTVLFEIMWLLKEYVPIVFVFSPTAGSNNAFKGIVHDLLVFVDVKIDILEEIYKRQEGAKRIYNIVNDVHMLQKIFVEWNSTGLWTR